MTTVFARFKQYATFHALPSGGGELLLTRAAFDRLCAESPGLLTGLAPSFTRDVLSPHLPSDSPLPGVTFAAFQALLKDVAACRYPELDPTQALAALMTRNLFPADESPRRGGGGGGGASASPEGDADEAPAALQALSPARTLLAYSRPADLGGPPAAATASSSSSISSSSSSSSDDIS